MGHSDMFSLAGKVIVVTGGTGVLGASFVKGIATQGGIPIILGQNAEKGNERVAEVKANGGDAHFISVNVLEEAQLVSAKNEILGKSIDPEKTYIQEIMPHKLELNRDFIENPTIIKYFTIIFRTIF